MGMFDFKLPKFKQPKIKTSIPRGTLPTKRDIAVSTNFLNKSIRERVPSKLRKEVLKRAKNKCEYPGCNIKDGGDIKLHIHHKDMINQNNKLSNLQALCATHHNVVHKKKKVVYDNDLSGRRIGSRVVSREKAKQIKKERKQNPLGLPKFDLGNLGFGI